MDSKFRVSNSQPHFLLVRANPRVVLETSDSSATLKMAMTDSERCSAHSTKDYTIDITTERCKFDHKMITSHFVDILTRHVASSYG